MNSHLQLYRHLFRQEGATRGERYQPALHPENVRIDNRQLKDLLLYIQRYAGHLRFIDPDNQPGGPETWADVLSKDQALLTAHIAACNLGEIRQVFDLLEEQFDKGRNLETLAKMTEYVLSMFRRLDNWYLASRTGERETRLRKDLELYIESYLASRYTDLRQIDVHTRHLAAAEEITLEEGKPLRHPEIWSSGREDRGNAERIFSGKDLESQLLSASLRLKEIFDTTWHVTREIVEHSNSYLEDSLQGRSDHQPHIALLVTFLELFGYAQEALNKIPRKHLGYYYQQVLGLRARQARPDTTFIHFETAKGFGSCELKKGTALSAGKNKLNKERTYFTDQDLVVHATRVSTVRNLFIEKDRHGQVLRRFTGADFVASGDLPDQGMSIFGDKAGDPGCDTGFAIASTQFYLTRGERKVWVRWDLEKDITVERFDTGIIELRLTGENSWLSSRQPDDGIIIKSLAKTGASTLELHFTISIGQSQAIVAFDPAVHGANFDTQLPVMQFLLQYPANAEPNEIIQLNGLQKIKPLRTTITVEVGTVDTGTSFDGVKDLLLQNHESVLDGKKPFLPFSGSPKVGSSFYIGCKDLYYKPVQRASLNIEWMLPDRFRGYYEKYLPPYDSNKFKAGLSILSGKKWQKINDISLIDTDANDARWRSIKIDLAHLRSQQQADQGVSRFDTSKMDGTLKLKLQYPDFGHGVYAQLITSTVMDKAVSGKQGPDFYKIVKKRLHDSAISIKLPADFASRTGPFKVPIYAVAESPHTDEVARTTMIKGLGRMIRELNGDQQWTTPAKGESAPDPGQRTIVNDDNLVERFYGFLRWIKVLGKDKHYDKDRQGVGDVVEEVKESIETRADFILPADREMIRLFTDVTYGAIDQTVAKVVDKIIAMRKGGLQPDRIEAIFREEFDEANEVINDLIASKLATLLQAQAIPPPPYTPQINMISLNYLSSRECTDEDQWFRITPYGVSTMQAGEIIFDERFLRRPNGLLFIGLSEYSAGQDISLLFRMAEGTGNTDLKPPALDWYYLGDGDWKPLPEYSLASDSTYNLQTTGILQLSLPERTEGKARLFDCDAGYWLCATATGDTRSFPRLIEIQSNAVTAQGDESLPAGTITKLSEKLPAIRKVHQPEPSRGGKAAEDEPAFFTRVSERLRHKARAITNWDYERLVLEQFAEVYKVKCLNDYRDGKFARGHVTLVPICTPRASFVLLREIEQYLGSRASTFVKVHAVNPLLSKILIVCQVKFRKGQDKGWALQKLDEDLIAYLSPWLEGDPGRISFTSRIYASSIISFIDRLPYVEYTEGLEMRQYTEDAEGERIYCKNAGQGISLIETQFIAGHAILVSAPHHDISLIS